MTITTSKDELSALINKAGRWYNDRAEAVFKNAFPNATKEEGQLMLNARLQFEKDNPKPTWKDLL